MQSHPSAVTFPDGESLMAMSMRAVSAIREWNQQLSESDVLAVVILSALFAATPRLCMLNLPRL